MLAADVAVIHSLINNNSDVREALGNQKSGSKNPDTQATTQTNKIRISRSGPRLSTIFFSPQVIPQSTYVRE